MSNISSPIMGPEVFAEVGIGKILLAGNAVINAYLPEGATEQVDVVTLASASNDSTYTITIACTAQGLNVSEAFSYTSDASATEAEIVEGLHDAFNDNAVLSQIAEASFSTSDDTVTFTGKGGLTFTTTLTANPSTDMSLASTAKAAGPSYVYGDVVQLESVSGLPAASADLGCTRPAKIDGSVLTFTITHAASETLTATIVHTPAGGFLETYELSQATGSSATNTRTLLGATLEAQFPTADVDTSVSNTVTVTFPGGDGASAFGAAGSGSSDLSVAVTDAEALVPAAIVLHDYATAPVESRTGLTEVTSTDPGQPVKAILPGDGSVRIGVAAQDSSYTLGGKVWYGSDSSVSAEYGKLFNAAGAGRCILPGASWVGLSTDSTIAILAL